MSDRRRAATETNGRNSEEHNPFAPPPEGAPDRPWRPRGGDDDHAGGNGDGNGAADGHGNGHGSDDEQGDRDERRGGIWGSQWSRRQPQRQSGPFGRPPGGGGRPNGRGGGLRGPERRWDPSDPKQRHARFALLAGMWGLVLAWLGIDWLAMFLGALGLYWGIDALLKPKPDASAAARAAVTEPAPPSAPEDGGTGAGAGSGAGAGAGTRRPQTPQATAGIVLSGLALVVIALQFAVQMVYKDYFVCVDDALTSASRETCSEHIPTWLERYLEPE
ncbi:hypothetical protein [Streptomyces aidingensis]|uniref:Uncharacterized protein n=1 Tax=Streptomyces aidingensis TaxID=910347 RepID=A0A1I1EDH2_9ACTN|nr:hypothetical protein [Streptomyces aidingensis]SFB85161.1 hypothetical protein SAMN05421773_101259 [Streptomyces aidingensis]